MTMAVIYTIALTTLDVKATISWSRPVESLKKSNLDNTWYRQDMQLQYPSWPHHGDYAGMAEAGGMGDVPSPQIFAEYKAPSRQRPHAALLLSHPDFQTQRHPCYVVILIPLGHFWPHAKVSFHWVKSYCCNWIYFSIDLWLTSLFDIKTFCY